MFTAITTHFKTCGHIPTEAGAHKAATLFQIIAKNALKQKSVWNLNMEPVESLTLWFIEKEGVTC